MGGPTMHASEESGVLLGVLDWSTRLARGVCTWAFVTPATASEVRCWERLCAAPRLLSQAAGNGHRTTMSTAQRSAAHPG